MVEDNSELELKRYPDVGFLERTLGIKPSHIAKTAKITGVSLLSLATASTLFLLYAGGRFALPNYQEGVAKGPNGSKVFVKDGDLKNYRLVMGEYDMNGNLYAIQVISKPRMDVLRGFWTHVYNQGIRLLGNNNSQDYVKPTNPQVFYNGSSGFQENALLVEKVRQENTDN